MSTWTTNTTVTARPEHVLDVLTDPDAIGAWSPIDFSLEELDGDRLVEGSSARVSGGLGGIGAAFDVAVHAADEQRFVLTADGPIGLDVEYELFPGDEASEVWVSIEVRRGRGISGRLLAQATEALLRAGALDRALSRIANEVERFAVAA